MKNRKPVLYVMCGIPASGKTTQAVKIANEKENTSVVSSDMIRQKYFGDINDQTHNKEVFTILYKQVNKLLKEGNNVVLDATNITIKMRKQIFNSVKVPCYKHCIVMTTTYMGCRLRDIKRDRTVGREVIKKFFKSFQIPFYEEGWDKIELHYDIEHEFNPMEYFDRMRDFNQLNHWHKYTLDIHCARTTMYLEMNYDLHMTDDLYFAAMLHDYGKLLTQTIDDRLEAHYYNHANAGAYYLMSFGLDNLNTLFYINYHMLHYSWHNEKTKRRYKKLFGDEKYNRLIVLSEADRYGSGTEEK